MRWCSRERGDRASMSNIWQSVRHVDDVDAEKSRRRSLGLQYRQGRPGYFPQTGGRHNDARILRRSGHAVGRSDRATYRRHGSQSSRGAVGRAPGRRMRAHPRRRRDRDETRRLLAHPVWRAPRHKNRRSRRHHLGYLQPATRGIQEIGHGIRGLDIATLCLDRPLRALRARPRGGFGGASRSSAWYSPSSPMETAVSGSMPPWRRSRTRDITLLGPALDSPAGSVQTSIVCPTKKGRTRATQNPRPAQSGRTHHEDWGAVARSQRLPNHHRALSYDSSRIT